MVDVTLDNVKAIANSTWIFIVRKMICLMRFKSAFDLWNLWDGDDHSLNFRQARAAKMEFHNMESVARWGGGWSTDVLLELWLGRPCWTCFFSSGLPRCEPRAWGLCTDLREMLAP